MKCTIITLSTLLLAATAAATPMTRHYPGLIISRQGANATDPPPAAGGGGNKQTFTGALGGAAPEVTDSGDAKRPFLIKGDTFVNLNGALGRSCDLQKNACAAAANAKSDPAITSVSQCDEQNDACHASFAKPA